MGQLMMCLRTLSPPPFTVGILLFSLGACAGNGTRPAPSARDAFAQEEETRQQGLALRENERQQSRLDDIAYPILSGGTPLCPGARARHLGARLATIQSYRRDLQPAATQGLELGDTLTVLSVTYGGPAGDGGLRPGDRIIAADQTPITPGAGAVDQFTTMVLADRRKSPEVSIALMRDGEPGHATVRLDEVCDYGSEVVESGDLNAFSDGKTISLTSAMMRILSNDEIGALFAHEFGHAARGHVKARQSTPTTVFSPNQEREADYVALYAMALAELPLGAAPGLWRHMAQADPRRTGFAGRHPITPERFERIQQVMAEIQEKRAAKVALLPTPPTAVIARSGNPLTQQIEVRPIPPGGMRGPEGEEYAPGGSAGRDDTTRGVDAGPEVQEAIRNLVRLGISRKVQEVRPGLLRVTVGDSFDDQSAVGFQLRLLYTPYAESYGDNTTFELVRGRVKIGEYTKDGLTLAAN
ncbi:MAG TPA: M48 family metallopeptidase [Gemmatimonadales bacterium]|nr:M48 family metallopeptidase [Gemmatimonadales bacterium]